MLNKRDQNIINFIKKNAGSSSKGIFENSSVSVSYATLKRTLTKLISDKYIVTVGKGKGTRYFLSPMYELIQPINIDNYYEKEIDERQIKEKFNFKLVNETLNKHSVFNEIELAELNQIQEKYKANIENLSPLGYQKEMERLAIDLSWKSSQIEGNTYSLLETEWLLYKVYYIITHIFIIFPEKTWEEKYYS